MKTKTKRTICRILGDVAFLAVLGIVGGMERGWMPLGRGAVLAVAAEIVGAGCWWKGGVMRVR